MFEIAVPMGKLFALLTSCLGPVSFRIVVEILKSEKPQQTIEFGIVCMLGENQVFVNVLQVFCLLLLYTSNVTNTKRSKFKVKNIFNNNNKLMFACCQQNIISLLELDVDFNK